MLPGQQRPYTATNTSTKEEPHQTTARPPKSASGLLPIVRPQVCQSALGTLLSKIDNKRHSTNNLSRPNTSYPYNCINRQVAQPHPTNYLQLDHTREWLSNKRVAHDEILIPRVINISETCALENTELYFRYQPPFEKEKQKNIAIEGDNINRSFFYNKKRRQADFDLMEQEMLAREEKYNNGKCFFSENTIKALRKTAQMITCSIPPVSAIDKDATESLLLSESASQMSTEVDNNSNKDNTKCHHIEELHKDRKHELTFVNESKPVSKPAQSHTNNHDSVNDFASHTSIQDSFLTEISNPVLSSKLATKCISHPQQEIALSHTSHTDTCQTYLLPNNIIHKPIRDISLHITSSVDLGGGSYNLSFTPLRPISRSHINTHIPTNSQNTKQTSRFAIAHTANKVPYTKHLVNSGPEQDSHSTPLARYSPIPTTILDFFTA